jgi:rhomboid protease GluP
LSDFATILEQARPERPVCTPLLVAANLAVFIGLITSGDRLAIPPITTYLEWGAGYGPAISAGEYWRLVSAAFLHFSPLHLFFNMWALWDAGRPVERYYGSASFLLLYLMGAASAGLASAGWYGDAAVSGGASGAVFAVWGGLGAFLVVNLDAVPEEAQKRLAKSLLVFVAASLYFGATQPGIDNAAHFAGLIAGFFLALPLARRLDRDARLSLARAGTAMAGGLFMLAMFAPALPSWRHDWRDEVPARRALERFEAEDVRLGDVTGAVERVRAELLPAWRAVLGDLRHVSAPAGSRIADRLRHARRYAALRVQMYAAWLAGVRAGDALKVKQAGDLELALAEASYDYRRTFERDYTPRTPDQPL